MDAANVLDMLWTFAKTFGLFFAAYSLLELVFPAHRQAIFRQRWGTDLAFMAGQFFLWNAPVVAVLTWTWMGIQHLPLHGLWDVVAQLPLWARLLIAILVSDVCIYWAHRISHAVPIMWRFHKVHHTSEHLDWIAAYREHPFDNLYTRMVENVPVLLLGVALNEAVGLVVFRGLWALVIHSNANINIGPLRYLIGHPRLHHWHHEMTHSGRCNFANLNPLMDLIFGTYHDPGHMPETYGVPEDLPHAWWKQMLFPLFPGRWK